MDICEIRSRNLNFVILDRYSFVELLSSISIEPRWIWICWAIYQALMNITHLFLGQICMQNAAYGLFTWMTKGLFGFKKSSLITHHSSLITHHSSLNFHHSPLVTHHLKYPNFLNPTHLAHCFQLLITQKFVLFVGPIAWAPCQAHGYHTHVYPLSPYKSHFLFFFFLFFHHSPPIPKHTVQTLLCPSILFLSPSPNNANFHLTESKQRWSLAKEIHPALISTQLARSPPTGSSGTDLLHHDPAVPIKNAGKDMQDSFHPFSPPLSSLSFLTSGFCLCLEKKFLDLLCGWTCLWVCVCVLVCMIGIMCLWVWFSMFKKSVHICFFFSW